MAFQHTVLFGNVIDVRQAGKNKVIVLAHATFSKDTNKKSPVYNIMSFARQSDEVAIIEDGLAARRAETGNEKAALQNVKIDSFVSVQADGSLQAQLSKLLSVGKTSYDAKPAAKAAPAEA